MTKPRVLIADPRKASLESTQWLIGSTCNVVSTVDDSKWLLEAIRSAKPDIAVIDAPIWESHSGLLSDRVLNELLEVRLIIVTPVDQLVPVAKILASGVSGCVSKRDVATELPEAIRQALRGGTFVSPRLLLSGRESHSPASRFFLRSS